MTDAELQALWSCPLIAVAHGRASFRHERFEHFLAAESLVIETADAKTLAALLNGPRCATLRADAVALEHDDGRLAELLSACEHSDLLFDAATGRLGNRAAAAVNIVLTDALEHACAQTAKGPATFDPGAHGVFGGQWTLSPSPTAHAQLATIGRLLARGRFLDGCIRLLDATDAVCARLLEQAPAGYANNLFAVTYALGGRTSLPATALVRAAAEDGILTRERPEKPEVALALLNRREENALGRLYLAAEFMHRAPSTPILAEVIVKCL